MSSIVYHIMWCGEELKAFLKSTKKQYLVLSCLYLAVWLLLYCWIYWNLFINLNTWSSVEAYGTKPIWPLPMSLDLLLLSVMMGFILFLITASITQKSIGLIVSSLMFEMSFLAAVFLVRGTIRDVYNFWESSLFLNSIELIVRWISSMNWLLLYKLSGRQSRPAALPRGIVFMASTNSSRVIWSKSWEGGAGRCSLSSVTNWFRISFSSWSWNLVPVNISYWFESFETIYDAICFY